jgi:FKBP12-rapamycin complex-associated protein
MMAVLEAFVYDPLINWRLITNPSSGPSEMDDKDDMSPMSDEDDSDISPDRVRPINSLSQSYDHVQHSETPDMRDQLNQRALNVIERVSNKLSGRDFPRKGTLDVAQQVDLLIKQASSTENLCQAYLGWCPYW